MKKYRIVEDHDGVTSTFYVQVRTWFLFWKYSRDWTGKRYTFGSKNNAVQHALNLNESKQRRKERNRKKYKKYTKISLPPSE